MFPSRGMGRCALDLSLCFNSTCPHAQAQKWCLALRCSRNICSIELKLILEFLSYSDVKRTSFTEQKPKENLSRESSALAQKGRSQCSLPPGSLGSADKAVGTRVCLSLPHTPLCPQEQPSSSCLLRTEML